MDILQNLDSIDKAATLSLNANMGSFADSVFWGLSSKLIWIPVALLFLYFVFRKKDLRPIVKILIVLALVLTITLCDQFTSSLVKPLVARFRPSHDIQLSALLHYVNGYHGGKYGFMSSHAANSFGAAVLGARIIKKLYFSMFLFVLATLVSYSRIYLGVHYLGDVVCGAIVGCLIGYGVFRVLHATCTYLKLRHKNGAKPDLDLRRSVWTFKKRSSIIAE